jgi:hypothetical protein
MNTEAEGEEDEEEEDDIEEEDAREEDAGEEDAGEEDAGEEDAGEEDTGEEDAGEEDAGEEDAGEEMDGDLDDSEEGKDLEEGPEKDAVMDKENGDDFEEQDDDGHSEPSKQAETSEADKGEDEEYGSEEDLAEDTRDKGQEEAKGQQEAEREVDRDGEETTSDEVQMHNERTGDGNATQVGQGEERKDDWEKGSVGDHGEVREDRELVEQQVTANHRSGAWRSWAPGYANGREEETRGTTTEGRERTIEADDGSAAGKRKRAFEGDGAIGTSPLGEYPNKRNKSIRGKDESEAPLEDSFEGGLETPSRPRTPSPMSPTLSPGSTIKIVRQTSVVPGLEDTENAVWDAAKRDSVISSLSLEQQTKMVRTALSLGSEEGIEELRRFVCNLRKDSKRGSDSLTSDSDFITPNPDLRAPLASNALVPQSDCIAHFSALYRRLDVLGIQETLFAITRRANLAAMAQYRESLVPKGAGGNRARDANLKLFRAVFPVHSAVERPEDKATNPAASRDWFRLRNRLNEGRAWLEVRNLFGGNGAFLALPPQCVPDSRVSRITAKNFGPLLGLLDVAWRALDDGARRTMDALVRYGLTGQSLPRAELALERPEAEIIAAPAGLSPMLAGWPESGCALKWSINSASAHLTEQKLEGDVNAPEVVRTTTAVTSGEEVVANAKSSVLKETIPFVDEGLLENVDFDERLSQQI